MERKIFIVPIEKWGYNGDRATQKDLYSDYAIYVKEESPNSEDVPFQVISGYDPFWSSIRPSSVVLREAREVALKLADLMGLEVQEEDKSLAYFYVSVGMTLLAANEEEAKKIFKETVSIKDEDLEVKQV